MLHNPTPESRQHRASRRGGRGIVVGIVLAVVSLLCVAAPTTQAAVNRAIHDETLVWTIKDGVATYTSPAARAKIISELANDLHVQTVRLNFFWSLAEPTEGRYDDTYIGQFYQAVSEARASGIKVMLAVYTTPEWASDTSLWSSPAFPSDETGYQPYYPPAVNMLPAWQRTAQYLATTFKGLVSYWECWNEPNLWAYLYPQQRGSDRNFGARRYIQMLHAFYVGIKAGDPAAKVLGGVTAPTGSNDRLRTSPQKFAAALKGFGAAAFMDGYSHHGYTPGGVRVMLPPEAAPRFPATTVSLGNISTLLRIFPGKPFYITEYGYTTRPVAVFGGAQVSAATQAKYLTRAYRLAAKNRQIKMLVWFQRKDWSPSETQADTKGIYFGLRDIFGHKKPSWRAYAQLGR